MQGKGGNDILYGNDGDDILQGDAENDHLIDDNGDDILKGGDDLDLCYHKYGNNKFKECENII